MIINTRLLIKFQVYLSIVTVKLKGVWENYPSVNVIIQYLLSVLAWPKVITLSYLTPWIAIFLAILETLCYYFGNKVT
jgi:amino acid permease